MDIGIPDDMGNKNAKKTLDYSYVKLKDDNHWW